MHRKILLVDDNLDAVETLAMLLRLDGHAVSTAITGPQAVEMAKSCQPELILLDIGLPGLNGYDVARRIRGMDELAGVRIYAVTGYGSQQDRERALESGFNGHFPKPLEYEQLRQLLA